MFYARIDSFTHVEGCEPITTVCDGLNDMKAMIAIHDKRSDSTSHSYIVKSDGVFCRASIYNNNSSSAANLTDGEVKQLESEIHQGNCRAGYRKFKIQIQSSTRRTGNPFS